MRKKIFTLSLLLSVLCLTACSASHGSSDEYLPGDTGHHVYDNAGSHHSSH